MSLKAVAASFWGGERGGDDGEEKYSSSLWMGLEMNCIARELVHFALKKKKRYVKPITQNTARDNAEEIPQPTPVVKAAQ